VADLDGDSFPDLVTANEYTNDVSVLINLPEPSARLAFLASVGLLGLLQRRQKSKRRCSIQFAQAILNGRKYKAPEVLTTPGASIW
jgi:hypothetical protein